MGGTAANPTYESVCSGKGGHSEALKVIFDPATISYEELLKVFFENHPYQYESKPQYMSAIFYQSEAQKASAEAKVAELRARGFKVATKLLPATQWYDAEEYHQDFHEKNRPRW
mmetsp:Transcript_28709/g.85792  ORF Transcript_28709/g.85792 Transcript_28709/m.85792 type:complete len:114 (+) Transcript_28709:259-600(+)